jgi:hypothetical protein
MQRLSETERVISEIILLLYIMYVEVKIIKGGNLYKTKVVSLSQSLLDGC